MDSLVTLFLPLSLAIIMLSLGIGLELTDFHRVARRPLAFTIGAISQVVILPLIAFAVLALFDLPAEFAVGVMLLSFCPGGVTSNILAKLSGGDVALSVSLTAVISLLSILTVPFFAAWSVTYFMGSTAPEVSITGLAIALFLIGTLPVLVGITIRHYARSFALRIEQGLSRVSVGLLVLIVTIVLTANWSTFVENVAIMGLTLITLNLLLLLVGYALGRAARLSGPEVRTISIETGIQNSTLGITLAGLITGVTEGFSAMALPSAVYAITMYLVVLPFVLWFRRQE